MKKLLLCTMLIFSLSLVAQEINGGPINSRTKTGVIDGVYLKSNIPTKRLIPYPSEREADVVWSRRVWRAIDLREKINRDLYYPLDKFTNPDPVDGSVEWVKNDNRWSLWTIIRQHVIAGDLIAYSDYNPIKPSIKDGDKFKYPIMPEPGKNYYTDSAFKEELTFYLAKLGQIPDIAFKDMYGVDDSLDVNGERVYPPRDTSWYTSADIVQYRLKEDWFFDKQRSVLDVRIIGLAPVKYKEDESGTINGTEVMFWLYFPTDCRYVFNNYYVFNEDNGARWMSFDDYFQKRRFSSFIYKEDNVYDRDIDKYRVGVDALMESRKITENIRNFESDVWSY